MSYFQPGAHIIIREVIQEQIWTARPVTVVQDTARLIALYIAPGTIYKHPRTPHGEPVPDTMIDEWVLIDQQWAGGGALYLSEPDAPYALILFWNENHAEFLAWYVNVQEPYRRTALGFDYLDLELDLVVKANRTTWYWKDEAKFAKLQQYGRISREQARGLRDAAERILAHIQHGHPFFASGWEQWAPPANWPIPSLPEGWEVIN
ncbi:MAG: DUF402 domain-containing protein [Chloroflexota bacterium]|nr:DUF402 domain-containing protein [Chloroflexota bacterium]